MTPRISDVVLHNFPTKYSTLRIIIREFLCVDGQGNGASGIIFYVGLYKTININSWAIF